jgi:dipeptidyl-peptidase 4
MAPDMFWKRTAIYLFLLASISTAALSLYGQEKKKLTFEQIFKNGEPKIVTEIPSVTGWVDDDHYIEIKKGENGNEKKTYMVDAHAGTEIPYSDNDLDRFKSIVDSSIDVISPTSSDATFARHIYSYTNDLFLLDTIKKEFKRLTQSPAEENNPTISPDGNYVAFTRENNLFIVDLNTMTERQITTDGSDMIYNGRAAWLYYEEIFGRPTHYCAFWWSPDSRSLAFYRFDETKVPIFPIYNSEGVHGFLENTRFPAPGDPNPEVKVGIVAVPNGSITWGDFDEHVDQYLGTPFWTPDSRQLFVQWMNREQDTLIIYGLNPTTGEKEIIYTEHQSSWVDWFESIDFLKDNNGFILKSDNDGWSHLYLFTMKGKLKNRITEGKWSVADIQCIDEDGRWIYFTARKEISTNTDLYRVHLNGKKLTRLTDGDFTHSITISPHGKYFISTYSNVSTPSRMSLFDNTGKKIRDLDDSKSAEFANYEIAIPEIFRVKTSDGINLPVIWTLPVGFDSTKKYPVLIDVYGGPGTYDVSNSWKRLRSQWLAEEGVIQVTMDHRGSAHFGKEGMAKMHRQLGKWEMNDYIEVVKWLRTKPFIDSTKICITGGSYGGYVTCMALTYGADYFTHGLANFSVTDYRLYDSHYTERFMDIPSDNPDGYKNTSAITWAERYKGLLRIVHGAMDDNVHMQNSIQLIDTLEDLGKHFEFMLYPGERHGWGGPKATHLRNETYRFYYKYLLEKEFPEKLFK